VLTYLAIKNQDVAGAEEATAMLKKLLPPGIAEPEEARTQSRDSTPLMARCRRRRSGPLIEQMGTALQNADAQMEKADAAGKEAEALAQQNAAETLRIKAYEAETNRTAAEAKAEVDRANAQTAQIKAEEARLKAEADIVRANAEAVAAADAAATEKQEKEAAPKPASVQEIAELLAATKAPPMSGMSIRAPSGGVYDIAIK
jgi:membrane protein involved in colicin uptake